MERKDKSLSRDKRILESGYPFVRNLVGTREAENEVREYVRPMLEEIFFELTSDEVMATIEGIDANLVAGKFRNAREAVAMFIVREIYLERVDAAQKFVCEVPSCEPQ